MSINVIIPIITFFLGIDTIIALEYIRDQNYSAALIFTQLHRGTY